MYYLPTETQPEQDDPTFAFTREEAQIDFSGIPIYMEHDEKMKVGKVRSCWNNPDGSKWIVGKNRRPQHLRLVRKECSESLIFSGNTLLHRFEPHTHSYTVCKWEN